MNMKSYNDLRIKIYADGADLSSIIELSKNKLIKGFTTNPTLMKKAGVKDYEIFAYNVLEHIQDSPISFEVFADDFETMFTQAMKIHSWGKNVYVKIPVMNTKGMVSYDLLKALTEEGVKLNVTAVFTLDQVGKVIESIKNTTGAVVSVFAGRLADAGIDPAPIMKKTVEMCKSIPNVESLWASPREVFNVVQGNDLGVDIITITPDILNKLSSIGKDPWEFSRETVQMFYNDATKAGYSL